MPEVDVAPSPPLLVACLCAGWCTACQAYGPVFAELARQYPAARFAWIDIEAHSDALGEPALDIENFPTVMLLRDGQPQFYGTVLPHAGTLARLVHTLMDHGALAAGQPCPPGFATAIQKVAETLPALG